jgi:mannose-6-phosphate isomerase-like protein (cupin superfamily)
MKPYYIQTSPAIVPANDGKLINEHFGKASLDNGDFSFAHMIIPPGWTETYQTPDFDEITFVISGRKQVEVDNKIFILEKNQSFAVKKGVRVKYSNPFDEPAEYISFCIPAFTTDRAHRE